MAVPFTALVGALGRLTKSVDKNAEVQASVAAAFGGFATQAATGVAREAGTALGGAGAGAAAASSVSGMVAPFTWRVPMAQASLDSAVTNALASVPVLGQLTGADRALNITGRARGRAEELLVDAARFGGTVDPEFRKQLLSSFVEQEKAAQLEIDAIGRETKDLLDEAAVGTPLEGILQVLQEIKAAIVGLGGGAGG